MTDAIALLERLDTIGVTVTVDGQKLLLEPGSRVPAELVEDVRQNKAKLIQLLKGYRQIYAGDVLEERELSEIMWQVGQDGYVLLWCHVLQDMVAFVRSNEDLDEVPPGFTPYTLEELQELFKEGEDAPSVRHLRLIHDAKKLGGRVIERGV